MEAGSVDHFTFSVPKSEYEKVLNWYLAALAPMNFEKIYDFGTIVGIGVNKKPNFWINSSDDAPTKMGFHIAFSASDHKTVDAFHQAAVKAGGKSNGEPGLRTNYHPNYYGAYVLDPLGNNVEVVDHSAH